MNMNLPNKLTILRVCMIPLFVIFMVTDLAGGLGKYIALILFVSASLTDLFDGYLARKYKMVTNFGKFMDPLADKLLVCAAMICLAHNPEVAEDFGRINSFSSRATRLMEAFFTSVSIRSSKRSFGY